MAHRRHYLAVREGDLEKEPQCSHRGAKTHTLDVAVGQMQLVARLRLFDLDSAGFGVAAYSTHCALLPREYPRPVVQTLFVALLALVRETTTRGTERRSNDFGDFARISVAPTFRNQEQRINSL